MMTLPSPRSNAVLKRLCNLHPKLIDLSLDRTLRLLDDLKNPQDQLPPVIHVAGTNGKGSTIAFLRSFAEGCGLSVHSYTSPHLIRFHERINLAGTEISEPELLNVLEECETANAGADITVFEITTAAAFLAFSRHPADLLLLETGLGGRLDSTNVISAPAVTVITPVSLDHTDFLGDSLASIAFEKAGILKTGVPCIVAPQASEALDVIRERAHAVSAPLRIAGSDWTVAETPKGVRFRDQDGAITLPRPSLPGSHQTVNAGTAIAAARSWRPGSFDAATLARGMTRATWPARLQQLSNPVLAPILDPGCELWVDGGHNPSAGKALSEALNSLPEARSTVLICGMQANKDAKGFLEPLLPLATELIAVTLPGGNSTDPDCLARIARSRGVAARTASDVWEPVTDLRDKGTRIVICGSLYLAGSVLEFYQLRQNSHSTPAGIALPDHEDDHSAECYADRPADMTSLRRRENAVGSGSASPSMIRA